uniref:Uncharacterized protein n=1 Tax=Terrapene triunguis TaxID=2587831 RepID=A0A674J9L3_9SAUR
NKANCTDIADFSNCLGNTEGFCPKDIVCGCKDNKPFCKCPYFRGLWGDYWYMGHKCEQLWNTLDLILVTVLPAVALAFLVGVIIQCVYYCKNKSSKTTYKYKMIQLLRQISLFIFTGDNAAHFLFTVSPESEDRCSHGTVIGSIARYLRARYAKHLYAPSFFDHHSRGHASTLMTGSAR